MKLTFAISLWRTAQTFDSPMQVETQSRFIRDTAEIAAEIQPRYRPRIPSTRRCRTTRCSAAARRRSARRCRRAELHVVKLSATSYGAMSRRRTWHRSRSATSDELQVTRACRTRRRGQRTPLRRDARRRDGPRPAPRRRAWRPRRRRLVTSYKLRDTSCNLLVISYKLRVTSGARKRRHQAAA